MNIISLDFVKISDSLKGNFGYCPRASFLTAGNRGKMSGSHLSTILKFASIQVSDTFTSGGYFRIFWTK